MGHRPGVVERGTKGHQGATVVPGRREALVPEFTGQATLLAPARTALTPAANELAGAGSGLLTSGPVSARLDETATALGSTDADN